MTDAKPSREWLKKSAESEARYPLAGDAKPDPLKELKITSVNLGKPPSVERAIAAWEKERADWREAHRQVFEAQQDDHRAISILRAAVEKVRDELRTPEAATRNPLDTADALDAALGGGA